MEAAGFLPLTLPRSSSQLLPVLPKSPLDHFRLQLQQKIRSLVRQESRHRLLQDIFVPLTRAWEGWPRTSVLPESAPID